MSRLSAVRRPAVVPALVAARGATTVARHPAPGRLRRVAGGSRAGLLGGTRRRAGAGPSRRHDRPGRRPRRGDGQQAPLSAPRSRPGSTQTCPGPELAGIPGIPDVSVRVVDHRRRRARPSCCPVPAQGERAARRHLRARRRCSRSTSARAVPRRCVPGAARDGSRRRADPAHRRGLDGARRRGHPGVAGRQQGPARPGDHAVRRRWLRPLAARRRRRPRPPGATHPHQPRRQPGDHRRHRARHRRPARRPGRRDRAAGRPGQRAARRPVRRRGSSPPCTSAPTAAACRPPSPTPGSTAATRSAPRRPSPAAAPADRAGRARRRRRRHGQPPRCGWPCPATRTPSCGSACSTVTGLVPWTGESVLSVAGRCGRRAAAHRAARGHLRPRRCGPTCPSSPRRSSGSATAAAPGEIAWSPAATGVESVGRRGVRAGAPASTAPCTS